MKLTKENKPICFILLAVFLVMTVLSFLTPMIADDYSYCFSFADYSRIESVGDIIESMEAHRETINGRIIAHSMVQFFLLLPKAVFNTANGLAAALFVFLISLYSDPGHEKKNAFVLAIAVLALWYFVPQFGEVFLWLDGAFSYGWAMLLSLLFVLPFYREFCGARRKARSWAKVLFVVFGFIAGAYSESISLAMLFIAFCLSAGILVQKRKVPPFLAAAFAAAVLGYLFLMLSPSELGGRAGEFSLSAIARSFEYAVELTEMHLGRLYCVFMLILAAAIEAELTKPKGERDFRPVVFAVIAFLGGLVSIAVFAFAKYFPNRAMCASSCWTITAGTVLLAGMFERRRAFVSGLAGILAALFVFSFVLGVLDVAVVYKKSNERLAQIAEAKVNGETSIVLEKFAADTKYSPAYELTDIAEGENEWPNDAIASYFGFETVSGK